MEKSFASIDEEEAVRSILLTRPRKVKLTPSPLTTCRQHHYNLKNVESSSKSIQFPAEVILRGRSQCYRLKDIAGNRANPGVKKSSTYNYTRSLHHALSASSQFLCCF